MILICEIKEIILILGSNKLLIELVRLINQTVNDILNK